MSEDKCVLCEAYFPSGFLTEGKCAPCKKLYPGVETKADFNKDKSPEVKNQEVVVKELVTKQVNELLESYGVLHRCLNCSSLYFKRSPAQKSCSVCSKVVPSIKETK